jgi:hypothetical protein
MALPHLVNAPERPLQMEYPQNFPFVMTTRHLPEIRNNLPNLAAALANEITNRARENAARTFVYNALVVNNWNNAQFIEAVGIAADVTCLLLRQRQSIEYAAQTAVGLVSDFITVQKMLDFPELQTYFGAGELAKAQEVATLKDYYKGEVARLYQTAGGGGAGWHTVGMAPQAPTGWHTVSQAGGFQRASTGIPTGAPGFKAPGALFEAGPQSRFADRDYGGAANTIPAVPVKPEPPQPLPTAPAAGGLMGAPTVLEATEQDWRPTPEQRYRVLTNTRTQTDSYHRVGQYVLQSIDIRKGALMERERHQILGGTQSLDSQLRAAHVVTATSELKEITGMDLTEAVGLDEVNEAQPPKLLEYVNPNWIYNGFLDAGIFDARLKKYLYQAKNTCGIYRTFLIVSNPVITQEKYQAFLKWLQSPTFGQMADKLRSLKSPDHPFNHLLKAHGEDFLLLCEQVENKLTDFINDFLQGNLGMPGLKITGFVSDIQALPGYFEEHPELYGSAYSQALAAFEKEIASKLFMAMSETMEKDFYECCVSIDAPVNLTFIVDRYSVTFIDLTFGELEFANTNGQGRMIDPGSHPILYTVAESLYQQKAEATHHETLYDLLITADNRILRLYKGYLTPKTYLIAS